MNAASEPGAESARMAATKKTNPYGKPRLAHYAKAQTTSPKPSVVEKRSHGALSGASNGFCSVAQRHASVVLHLFMTAPGGWGGNLGVSLEVRCVKKHFFLLKDTGAPMRPRFHLSSVRPPYERPNLHTSRSNFW